MLIDRALALADSAPTDAPYPAEELEWLATTTFNRAVDAYCAHDEESRGRQVEDALNVAQKLAQRDGGKLREAMAQRARAMMDAS